MKKFVSVLYIGLVTIGLLQAADINTTIVDGNTTVYNALLKTLNQEKNITSTIEVQKSLLQLLMVDREKLEKKKVPNITVPKNSSEYKQLFEQYLDTLSEEEKVNLLLTQNNEKIETIESEIGKLESNSTKILSLQLQDALYHKNIEFYKNEKEHYTKSLEDIEKILTDTVSSINVNTVTIKKNLDQNRVQEQEFRNKVNRLEIKKEQAELIANSKKSLTLKKSIEKLQEEHKNLLRDTMDLQFLLFINALQKKDKQAFSIEKKLLDNVKMLNLLSSNNKNRLTLLLHKMEQTHLGRLQTLTGSGEEELKLLWHKIWKFISEPFFNINDTPISIVKLILALSIFIFGFILGSLYKRKIKHMTSSRRSFTSSTRTVLANLGYYLIILISFFVVLNVLGIKLSSLAFIAGALSVGIGFGLQNVVSNFVSGLILMFERSITIGDYIQIDNDLRGYVSDIRMRSTTVSTNDNIDIIIPNQELIENNVINWTMSDNIRRFSIPFGVAYGTDAHRVIELVRESVLESPLREDIVEDSQHETSVIMTEMGDSSVNFNLFVWVRGDQMKRPKKTASAFLIVIYDTLNENNIEIPFPQRDLNIRSIDESLSFLKSDDKESKE